MILAASPEGGGVRLGIGRDFSARATALRAVLAFVLLAAPCPASAAREPQSLPVGATTTHRLRSDEAATFALPASSALPLRILVEEDGVDVRVGARINGKTLHTFDADMLRYGTHVLAVLAPIDAGATLDIAGSRPGSPAGDVRVTVTVLGGDSIRASGDFALDLLETDLAQRLDDPALARAASTADLAAELQRARAAAADIAGAARAVFMREKALSTASRRPEAIKALRSALPLFRQIGDRRGEACALNDIGMQYFRMGDGRLAEEPLREAYAAAEPTDDDLLKAIIRNNVCLTQRMRGDERSAQRCFEQALALSERTGDALRIATAYNNLGGAFSQRGDTRRASAAFERALAIREGIGDTRGTGDPLHNLGLERQTQGRFDEALVLFDRATTVYRDAHDLRGLALVTRSRGQLYLLLGDFDRARSLMEEALAYQRELGRRDDIIHTLTRLAEADSRLGRDPESLAKAGEAVELARVDGDPHLLAETLVRAARLHAKDGDGDKAVELATEAGRWADSVADADLGAMSALELARAALATGQYSRASAQAGVAYEAFARREGSLRRADALSVRAQARARLGDFRAADRDYERGQREIERARSYVFDPELRSTFLATQSQLFVDHVSLLMGRAQATGDRALAARALASSERYRARVLLDRREFSPFPATAPSSVADARAELIQRLSALAMARWRTDGGGESAKRRAELSRDMVDTEERLRVANARHAGTALETATAADFPKIQTAIDKDTVLVDYFVTDAATYAWTVKSGAFAFHVLPGRGAVEMAVRSVLDSLGNGARSPSATEDALASMCDLVWRPLGPFASEERIVIVADGPLAQLPYAALRCKDEGTSYYLVERHEISYLPSASLIARPASAASRAHGDEPRALAIVDPIYSRDDARIAANVREPSPADASGGAFASSFLRLPGGRTEVDAMKRTFGAGRVLVLDGSDASLARLRSSGIGDYDIVHFATHGLADSEGLRGSGLVLSLFDASGREQEGFLSMAEIAQWRLGADLVVIGACDSAAGKAVDGEGVMSVAYGMLVAGARQVVAPLWAIDDGSGSKFAELMYGSFRDHAGSRAVREAQVAMLESSGRLRAPRYWAAFVTYGISASM